MSRAVHQLPELVVPFHHFFHVIVSSLTCFTTSAVRIARSGVWAARDAKATSFLDRRLALRPEYMHEHEATIMILHSAAFTRHKLALDLYESHRLHSSRRRG